METQRPAARIGDILVECGMAAPEAIERALELSRTENIRLGEALIRLCILTEDQLTWALGVQFDLSYVDLSEDIIDWRSLIELPLETLRSMRLLPLTQAEDTVHAVVADPTTPGLAETLRFMFPGRQLFVQLASGQSIDALLDEAEKMRATMSEAGAMPLPTNAPTEAVPARIPDKEDSAGASGAHSVISEWIQALCAGGAEAIAMVPCPGDPAAALVRAVPESAAGGMAKRLSAAQAAEIASALCEAFPGAPEADWGFYRLARGDEYARCAGRAQMPPAEMPPLRILKVSGLSGPLLAIQALRTLQTASLPADAPAAGSAHPMFFLSSGNAWQIKAQLETSLAENQSATSQSGPFILLESLADGVAPHWFQAEIADAQWQIRLVRVLLAATAPGAIGVELDSAEDLLRMTSEPPRPRAGPLLFFSRAPMPDGALDAAARQVSALTIVRLPEAKTNALAALREILFGSEAQ